MSRLVLGHFSTSQAKQFGSSPLLQSNDYEAKADLLTAHSSYQVSSSAMTIALTGSATRLINTVSNQFRLTLSPDTFSNFNGKCRSC